MLLPSVVFLCVVSSLLAQQTVNVSADLYQDFYDHQLRLNHHLFRTYRKTWPPLYTLRNCSLCPSDMQYPDRMVVTVGVNGIKLLQIVETQQIVILLFDYRLEWTDFRLRWDPADFGGIEYMYMNAADVWIPDIAPHFVYGVDEYQTDGTEITEIRHDGSAKTFYLTSLGFACILKMSDFPFDIQTCEIGFSSQGMLISDYKLETSIFEVVPWQLAEMSNGEWEVLDVRGVTAGAKGGAGGAAGTMQMGLFEIKLKRNSIFYILLFILPTFAINFVAIIGIFEGESAKNDRLNVGLQGILAQAFLLGVVTSMTPKTNECPLLVLYLILSLTLLFCCLLIVMCVDNKIIFEKKQIEISALKLRGLHNINRYHVVCTVAFSINLFLFIYLFIRKAHAS